MTVERATLPRVDRDTRFGFGNPVFFHACTEGTVKRSFLPLGADGWAWGEDGSVTPSIHCTRCGTHGFWRGDAGWVSA